MINGGKTGTMTVRNNEWERMKNINIILESKEEGSTINLDQLRIIGTEPTCIRAYMMGT